MPSLPHNLEAEKCVLGAILINNQAFNQAAEVIDAEDFFRDAHRRIFEKMVGLTDRSQPVDLVTLKDELARSGDLDEVGGPAYISALTDGVPRSANVEYYARIVKEKSTLRRLIQSAIGDPLARPGPELDRPLEDRPVGGLGIFLVRQLMDEASYERRHDRNRLVLKKRWSAT